MLVVSVVDIYAILKGRIVDVLTELYPCLQVSVFDRVEVVASRDPSHGDFTTNGALVVAKSARRPPAEIASMLADRLAGLPDMVSAEPGGAGFVNMRLHPGVLKQAVSPILRMGEAYGDCGLGQGTRVNVEYVSANPTGPMHIGHCRGAVVGDALANLLSKAGFQVTKEYYVNDAGAQVSALAWAAYWRYLQALGTSLTEEAFAAAAPGGLQYRGDYLVPVGRELADAHGAALAGPAFGIADPAIWLDLVRDATIAAMMAAVRADLDRLGVRHDVFTSERELVAGGAADRVIARMAEQGLIYEGTLPPPKGKLPEDWEAREQTLFRATQFGDDIDRPLRKSDGSNTYFANDIAYHADKAARGADILIDVLGADHGGYVPRMRAAVRALPADPPVRFEAVICQIVHVLRDGQPVKMSKRAGTYVTLADLIDEVGRDAVRFTMLTRKSDAQMEFDLNAVVAQTRENPVFYVQYAHARCRSVLRAAAEMLGAAGTTDAALAETDLSSLTHEAEMAVVRRLIAWPRTVQGAAQAREPHRIAFYLHDLAADFHALWNRGREDTTLRFIRTDEPRETAARLALVAAVAVVIRSGLQVLGVTPVEEMR